MILDEFHERSRHTDLAAAFLREAVDTVRPDLLLVAASATLDAAPLARFLGPGGVAGPGAPVVEVEGGLFPVEIRWADRVDPRPVPLRVAAAVRQALSDAPSGDVLVFLAGAPEIRRAAEALGTLPGAVILPLHGELSPEAQDRVLGPAPQGLRKVILSTNVAETSLTIPGVTAVVDSGEAKVLRLDPRSGLDRLEKGRISKASAVQRAGRAGRLAPGTCYRLWSRDEERSLADFEVPEVLRTDLADTLLSVLAFSPRDPREFGWFERPPEALLERGIGLLARLGAVVPPRWSLTDRGRLLSRLGLPPRVGALAAAAAERGLAGAGALLASLLEGRDLLRPSSFGESRGAGGGGGPETRRSDLVHRFDLVREAEAGRLSPALLGRLGLDGGGVRAVLRGRDRIVGALRRSGRGAWTSGPGEREPSEEELLPLVLAGYPDRVARRLPGGTGEVVLVGGRRALLGRECGVLDSPLLVALEIVSGGPGPDRVVSASEARVEWLEPLTGVAPVERTEVRWDDARESVVAAKQLAWQGLVLDEREVPAPAGAESSALLVAAARRSLPRALDLSSPAFVALRGRIAFVARRRPETGLAPVDDAALEALLPELAEGRRRLDDLRAMDLASTLLERLGHRERRALEEFAPTSLPVPTGRSIALDWSGEVPVLAVKLQELFGLGETPRVDGGRMPVLLHLLSPAGRPVQVTSDLASFWNRTYPEVRRELRGRYPRHPWPEDPWNAPPERGARKRRS